MDIFFRFIALMKRIFVKEKEVYMLNNDVDWEKVIVRKKYTVKIKTEINSMDTEIVNRYYEVVGLTNKKQVKSLWAKDTQRDINTICEHVKDAIELDSNVKIDPKKLYKAILICYSGEIVIGDISIKFDQC